MPLWEALCRRHQTVVQLLVDAGADLSGGDAAPYARVAVEQNDAALLGEIVRHGGDVSGACSGDGTTALHRAVLDGNVQMARLLLEHAPTPTPRTSTASPSRRRRAGRPRRHAARVRVGDAPRAAQGSAATAGVGDRAGAAPRRRGLLAVVVVSARAHVLHLRRLRAQHAAADGQLPQLPLRRHLLVTRVPSRRRIQGRRRRRRRRRREGEVVELAAAGEGGHLLPGVARREGSQQQAGVHAGDAAWSPRARRGEVRGVADEGGDERRRRRRRRAARQGRRPPPPRH